MAWVFKFTINGRPYTVEVEDISKSPLTVTVNGQVFQVDWEREGDASPKPVGRPSEARPDSPPPPAFRRAESSPIAGNGAIRAPMPGKILAVKVSVGDKVSYGQEVCVLEAMKMEQSIRVSQTGVVKEVLVIEGQMVKHGDVLIVFEKGE